jgi:hypothetical protein
MPTRKKRALNLKQFQGTSGSGAGGASRRNGVSGADSPTSTVNERLNDSRKAEAFEAAQKKRELAEASAFQRSVPPELNSILGVPQTAPPKVRAGVRVRESRAAMLERRRTPGPAAPKSWLGFPSREWEQSLVATGGVGRRKGKRPVGNGGGERRRPDQLMRFKKLIERREGPSREPEGEEKGLLHLCLKRLAENWDALDEQDYPALLEIPVRLRLRFLSYLGCFGPVIDVHALEALLMGTEELKMLDLSALAGHSPLSMKKLAKFFEASAAGSSNMRSFGNQTATHEIADSWEDVEPTTSSSSVDPLSTISPTLPSFANLTHLSLSHPPLMASWRHLLALTKQTTHLTHLSLAYWPRPTLTPNLTTATVSSPHGREVRAGGSHFYSRLDEDYTEAAALLRQLSATLLCLKWLDLEGCTDWVPALAHKLEAAGAPPDREARGRGNGNGNEWTASNRPSALGIFTDTWRNLEYIRCAQGGPLPTLLGLESAELELRGNWEIFWSVKKHRLEEARCSEISAAGTSGEGEGEDGDTTEDFYDAQKRFARVWVEREGPLYRAARNVNVMRRRWACRSLVWDFGWWSRVV